MIKITDYICDYLADKGVRDVFMISGGGAMHLVDSIGRHLRLRYICPHHEQSAAMAAEGYFRTSGKMAAVMVTSGPGGTNALTGVMGQWVDSVPAFYISGQVKRETTTESCPKLGLRQLGDQEIGIVNIVRHMTKYAAVIKDPYDVRYHLDKAFYLATHGRPGPVWLDVPLDIQGAIIDERRLRAYDCKRDEIKFNKAELRSQVRQALTLLKRSKRPVFLAGQGIRIASARDIFLKTAQNIRMPVLTSFCGFDLIPSDHPLYAGRVGTLGTRFGNFAVQNADLLISVGSRNNIRQISYNRNLFAKNAKKIIVDIDKRELKKPTMIPDLAIHADAKEFLLEFKKEAESVKLPDWKEWLRWNSERKCRYPVVLPQYWLSKKTVNPYCFMESLTRLLDEDAVVAAGNGTACLALFQAGIVKKRQRMFWNSGCVSMGYDLPAAIGASFAAKNKPVICLAGDGSLQMNIQELQTIAHHKLPIKLFVLNNEGYCSIRQTQDTFFDRRHIASGPDSGVTFPDIIKVAKAYGLAAERISDHAEMKEKIKRVLRSKGPIVCEVRLTPSQKFVPKVASEKKPDGSIVSAAFDDMYPFLSREELRENRIEG